MNEHDYLEAELAALRPTEPSDALRQRIADEIAVAPAAPPRTGLARRMLVERCVAASLIVAASLVLFAAWHGGGGKRPFIETPVVSLDAGTAVAFDPAFPSLWAYRRAVRESADGLEALLDQHTRHSPETKPQRAGSFVFALSDSELENLLGEL